MPFQVRRIGKTVRGETVTLDDAALQTMPARVTLTARRSLTLELDAKSLRLRLVHGRKELEIPLDELVHEEIARGFGTRDTVYAKADLAVAYAWRWVLGQTASRGKQAWRRLVG
jgi:hypothetical protein